MHQLQCYLKGPQPRASSWEKEKKSWEKEKKRAKVGKKKKDSQPPLSVFRLLKDMLNW